MNFQFISKFIPRKLLENLEFRVKRAGYEPTLIKKLFTLTSWLTIILTGLSLLIYIIAKAGDLSIIKLLIFVILFALLFLVLLFVIVWGSVFMWLSIKRYKRSKEIENVLGDYLQLVSATVEPGLTIEQSLWYAIRPNFGVLAKEIELVAKKTMSGTDLSEALIEFGEAYDSDLLKKSLTILIEGLEAGGRLAELLNKISWNIKETQILRKEIASSVTTYAMFIAFSSLLAAPFLYALSYQLINIMAIITARIDLPETAGSISLPISGGGLGIAASDFRIFAIVSLVITALFSALIVATVKKGDVKAGFRSIPTYIIVVLVLFFIISAVLGAFLGKLI